MDHQPETKEQALKELQEVRRQFNDFLYFLPDALLEIDLLAPRLTYMNRMAYIVFGYTEADFAAGIEISTLFAEGEYERAIGIITGYVGDSLNRKVAYERSGKQDIYEFRMRRKDGSVFHAETLTSFVLGEDRIPIRMRTLIRDVTARKQAEEVSRERETWLRLVIEQLPALLWTTEAELRITSSVGAALADLNLKPNQTNGMTMSEYFRTDDPNFFPIVAHRRALAGESATYEHEWAGNCYQIHLEPLRDAEGRIVGCIGIALDITVRKRAQQGYLDRYEVQFKRKDGSPYRTLLSLRPILIKGKRCWQAVVEDITAHKHAEEALQKAHAELLHANTVLQEQIAERKCPQPPGESHFVGASLAGKRAGIAQFDRTNYPF